MCLRIGRSAGPGLGLGPELELTLGLGLGLGRGSEQLLAPVPVVAMVCEVGLLGQSFGLNRTVNNKESVTADDDVAVNDRPLLP